MLRLVVYVLQQGFNKGICHEFGEGFMIAGIEVGYGSNQAAHKEYW